MHILMASSPLRDLQRSRVALRGLLNAGCVQTEDGSTLRVVAEASTRIA